MSSLRRAARGTSEIHTAVAGPMPAELMSGPCIEDWADKKSERRPVWATSNWPAFQARRNWQDAVQAWAERSGWASEKRPASNAQNLARIRIPWSLGCSCSSKAVRSWWRSMRAGVPHTPSLRVTGGSRSRGHRHPTALAKGAMT